MLRLLGSCKPAEVSVQRSISTVQSSKLFAAAKAGVKRVIMESAHTSNAPKPKLGGYDFYRSIGSPKWVVGPMVDQSELAWRILSRSPVPVPDNAEASSSKAPATLGGATLCYTPMINAKLFANAKPGEKQDTDYFDIEAGEEGSHDCLAGLTVSDRPLIVQFCANDPDYLLAAAKKIQHRCDAVDINFGCPQHIAKRGRYGAFLQDDWELVRSLINKLHTNLSIPVTAKFRVFPDVKKTIAYAQMMEAAGAQILTCHGRTREMKGHFTGLADWEKIKAVKQAVNVPVFANGNILYREDVERCLEFTGCDGVMTAEGNLSNPAIFLDPTDPRTNPSQFQLAHRYLDIVAALKTQTASSAIKAHLFRLLKPTVEKNPAIREKLGCMSGADVGSWRELVHDLEAVYKDEIEANPLQVPLPPLDPVTGLRTLPVWAAQPYIRAPKSAPSGNVTPLETSEAREALADASETPAGNNLAQRCTAHSACSNIAASQCPRAACITHCREAAAIATGMDATLAREQAAKGGLEGRGCEAHEEKVRARKERNAARAEMKRAAKKQKKASKT